MMQAFFKDLVCHPEHDDSFEHSGSEGGDSPQEAIPRTNTVVCAKPTLSKGRRSVARSLEKDWSSDRGAQLPVWEDIEPPSKGPTAKKYDSASTFLDGLGLGIDLSESIKVPAVTRIPKHQRLSFGDENEGINTVRAARDENTDRCKEMEKATKQAAQREDAARAMLNAPAPPKRSPALGGKGAPKTPSQRLPSPPHKGKLGFGSSSRRLDALPPPPNSSRSQMRGETPEPSGHSARGARAQTPLQKRGGAALPQRPQGPPPTRQPPPPSPRDNSVWQMHSPQRIPSASGSFMCRPGQPGPPRCPSNSSLNSYSAHMGRSQSAGRIRPVQRSNSYVPGADSFTLSSATNQSGVWSHPAPDAPPVSARSRNMNHSPSLGRMHSLPPASQTNSYVPPPAQNSVLAPGSPMSRNNSANNLYAQLTGQSCSYVPPPSSPMVVAPSHPSQSADPQYPNSIERIREAGMAMCSRLFAPPPRMLSFEPPAAPSVAATPGPAPARMLSCEAFMPLPLPPPHGRSKREGCSVAAPSGWSFEPVDSPLVRRENSYDRYAARASSLN